MTPQEFPCDNIFKQVEYLTRAVRQNDRQVFEMVAETLPAEFDQLVSDCRKWKQWHTPTGTQILLLMSYIYIYI